jgi:predicted tellurium resistance membrane protein TerC
MTEILADLLRTSSILALVTLAVLEIVLGIDNVVFLAILSGKLPPEQQAKARRLGLGLAALGRILLLFAISWVITLDKTVLFTLPFEAPGAHEIAPAGGDGKASGTPITAKDLVLILGGLFLLGKATWEIGHQLEGHASSGPKKAYASFGAVLVQIFMIDMVFSLDSVLTAVGMVPASEYKTTWAPLIIMITAVLLAIGVMLAFSGPISNFVNRHPSVKMLALAFLILIGVVLIAEGFHTHIPRGYIYSSMAFSLLVETLNLRASRGKHGGGST